MKRRPRILMAVGIAGAIVAIVVAVLGWILRGPIVFVDPGGAAGPAVSPARLEESVTTLVEEFPRRGYAPPENLDRVADWVAARFEETGLEVTEQRFSLGEGEYRNVIATRPGSDPTAGIVIVGAHYDAYDNLPGADDNASGVAVLLELMRTLPEGTPGQTQVFVAFANEEPPLFGSEDMGSHRYVRKLMDEGVEVDLMIALDLVGYFSDEPDSQQFPAPGVGLYYPSTGNFIAVVGDLGAGNPIARVKRGMRSGSDLPVVSFRGPKAIPGIMWSDHLWFREYGMPAVLVTDTAMLRNPNYHRSTDLPETLDYDRMAEVVRGLHGVLK